MCAVCEKGYHPGSDGSCVPNCKLPCRECEDNKPSVCTSCYYLWDLADSSCTLNLECNAFDNCTDCGQGGGYILAGFNCIKCPVIANCKQCSQTNSSACSICDKGYFINDTICSACPSRCTTCKSDEICTGCAVGYTLPEDMSEGRCIACQ